MVRKRRYVIRKIPAVTLWNVIGVGPLLDVDQQKNYQLKNGTRGMKKKMSKKVDITIGRTLTVNTGNYQSVKPSVLITLKDVDIEDVENICLPLSVIVEDLIKIETVKATGQIKEIENEGHMGWCKSVLETIDDIEESITENLGIINDK